MEKTLFSEVYLIGKIKITICVGGTVIANKKCYSGELKLYKPLMITYFAVVFHISYPPNFCFLSSYFLSHGIHFCYQFVSVRNLF